jgi:hypothetical protein
VLKITSLVSCFGAGTDTETVDKLHRLKYLAIDAKDHDWELKFPTGAYRSKRFHETNGLALFLSYLYDWLD